MRVSRSLCYTNLQRVTASRSSIDSLRTSPPSIPRSAPAPHKSRGPTPTPQMSQDRPSTSRVRFASHTSQGRSPTPRNTPGSTPSARGDSQALNAQGKSRERSIPLQTDLTNYLRNTGTRMPPPKVPAKRQAPTHKADEDPAFGSSPLTETPKTPPRKRQKATQVVPTSTRKTRAASQAAGDD